MNQLPMIYGIGPSLPKRPAIPTASPLRIEVQTEGGSCLLSMSFEAAREMQKELDIYLKKYSPGR